MAQQQHNYRQSKKVRVPKGCDTLSQYLEQLASEQRVNVPARYNPWVLQQIARESGHSEYEGLKFSNVAEQAPGLWERLQQRFRGYTWNAQTEDPLEMSRPCHQGEYLSFATLVLIVEQRVDVPVDPFPPRVMKRLRPLLEVGDVGVEFVRLLLQLDLLMPLEKEAARLEHVATWLRRAQAGEASTVLTVVCPDYAYDSDRRYTFETLECGIGLVAERAVNAAPLFNAFFVRHNLPVTFQVAVADFEGDSEATRESVSGSGPCMTEQEFSRRCQGSVTACRETIGDVAEVVVFSELGVQAQRDQRDAIRQAIEHRIKSGAFRLPRQVFQDCWDARQSVLKRWHGDDATAIQEAFWRLAVEYGMVGTVARSQSNCLVFGVESPDMAPFLEAGSGAAGEAGGAVPYLYLQKVEY